jgi:hypothetical protein
MSATKKTVEEMRAEYRAIRSAVPAAKRDEFDHFVRMVASDISDGEEIKPSYYLTGARQYRDHGASW